MSRGDTDRGRPRNPGGSAGCFFHPKAVTSSAGCFFHPKAPMSKRSIGSVGKPGLCDLQHVGGDIPGAAFSTQKHPGDKRSVTSARRTSFSGQAGVRQTRVVQRLGLTTELRELLLLEKAARRACCRLSPLVTACHRFEPWKSLRTFGRLAS